MAKAKYDAWNSLGEMSQDDAKEAYIEYVNELVGDSSQAPATGSYLMISSLSLSLCLYLSLSLSLSLFLPVLVSTSICYIPIEVTGDSNKVPGLTVTHESGVTTVLLDRPDKFNALTWEVSHLV